MGVVRRCAKAVWPYVAAAAVGASLYLYRTPPALVEVNTFTPVTQPLRLGEMMTSQSGRYQARVISLSGMPTLLVQDGEKSAKVASGPVIVAVWSPADDVLAYQVLPKEKPASQAEALAIGRTLDVMIYDVRAGASRVALDNPDGLDLLVGQKEGIAIYTDRRSSMRMYGDVVRVEDGAIISDDGSARAQALRDYYAINIAASLLLSLPFIPLGLRMLRRPRLRPLNTDGQPGFFDSMAEHPLAFAAASVLPLAYASGLWYGKDILAELRACKGGAWQGLCMYALANSAIALAASTIPYSMIGMRKPRWSVFTSMFRWYAKELGGQRTRESLQEQLSAFAVEDRDALYCRAQLHALDHEYDQAALCYARAVQTPSLNLFHADSFNVFRLPYALLMQATTTRRYRAALRQQSIDDLLELEFSAVSLQDRHRVRRIANVLARRSPELGVLQGLALKAVGDEQRAAETMKDAILPLLQTSGWERVGEYEVYRMGPGEFLKNTVILKAARVGAGLRREEALTRLARVRLAQHDIDSADVLTSVLAADGRFVLPLRHEGRNELLAGSIEAYVTAAHHLGVIHAVLAIPGFVNDEYAIAPHRRVVLASLSSADALDGMSAYARNANAPFKTVFKKDPHPKNWMMAADGRIIPIDFAELGATTPPHELAKLLFNRPRWSDGERHDVMEGAQAAYSEGRAAGGLPLSRGERDALPVAIAATAGLRAASFLGETLHRPSLAALRQGFVENALCLARESGAPFTGYLEALVAKA